MTSADKARQIVTFICGNGFRDETATEYVRAHLERAHAEGVRSGIEQARQSLNMMCDQQAAE